MTEGRSVMQGAASGDAEDDRLSVVECAFLGLATWAVLFLFAFPQSLVDYFTSSTQLPPELVSSWLDEADRARFLKRLPRHFRWVQAGSLLVTIALVMVVKSRMRLCHATVLVFGVAVLLRLIAIGDVNGDEARTWLNFIELDLGRLSVSFRRRTIMFSTR